MVAGTETRHNKQQTGGTIALWIPWWNVIWLPLPAFTRLRTFLWFATAVAGLTVGTELLGVTSIVRTLKLRARFYHKLLESFPVSVLVQAAQSVFAVPLAVRIHEGRVVQSRSAYLARQDARPARHRRDQRSTLLSWPMRITRYAKSSTACLIRTIIWSPG